MGVYELVPSTIDFNTDSNSCLHSEISLNFSPSSKIDILSCFCYWRNSRTRIFRRERHARRTTAAARTTFFATPRMGQVSTKHHGRWLSNRSSYNCRSHPKTTSGGSSPGTSCRRIESSSSRQDFPQIPRSPLFPRRNTRTLGIGLCDFAQTRWETRYSQFATSSRTMEDCPTQSSHYQGTARRSAPPQNGPSQMDAGANQIGQGGGTGDLRYGSGLSASGLDQVGWDHVWYQR